MSFTVYMYIYIYIFCARPCFNFLAVEAHSLVNNDKISKIWIRFGLSNKTGETVRLARGIPRNSKKPVEFNYKTLKHDWTPGILRTSRISN